MAVPPRYKATTTVRANNMRTAKSFGFFSRNNLLVKLAVKYCKPLATQFRLWCPVQFFFLRSVPLKERFDGRRALAARKSQGHQGVLQGYNVQCVPVYLYTLSMLIYFTHRDDPVTGCLFFMRIGGERVQHGMSVFWCCKTVRQLILIRFKLICLCVSFWSPPSLADERHLGPQACQHRNQILTCARMQA